METWEPMLRANCVVAIATGGARNSVQAIGLVLLSARFDEGAISD
jgi:hypothetical protein